MPSLPSGWRDPRPIRNGEDVAEVPANRPALDVYANLLLLKQAFEEAMLGSALYARDKPIESALQVGQSCFYNDVTGRFERALSATETDPDTGLLRPAKSAYAAGVLSSKSAATVGTILLAGEAALEISPAEAVPVAGLYYVSGTTPGELVLEAPGLGVPVLYNCGNGRVIMACGYRRFLDDHVHYSFDLVALPAGATIPPGVGDPHAVDDPDPDAPGWLPADHEVFEDMAPAGAKFGYNLAAHPGLDRVWPPVPISAVSLTVERPPLTPVANETRLGGTVLSTDMVVCDQYGIWWMSDCYNQAPWPVTFEGSSSSGAGETEDDPACGPAQDMRITLYFSRQTFLNAGTAVTSLQAANSSIVITNCDGQPARTGDLFIRAVIGLLGTSDANTGALALKSMTAEGQFTRGPVLSGIRVGGRLSAASTTTSGTGADKRYYGDVELDVDLDVDSRELQPVVIKLENAREAEFDDDPYVGFPAGLASGVRLKFEIGTTNLPATPVLVLQSWIAGRTTGTLPALTAVYRIASDPEDDELPLPTSDDDVAVALTYTTGITANHYRALTSAEIPVAAGDVVYVHISRSADDDYAGEVGLIKNMGRLQTATV